MRTAFEVMGGEPWRFTPTEIGLLTDRQIWDQYVRPAVRAQKSSGANRSPLGKAPKGDGVPSREAFVNMGVTSVPGSTKEHWEAEYDGWAASNEGQSFLNGRKARGSK